MFVSAITNLDIKSAQEVVSVFASYLYDPKKLSKDIRSDMNSLRYHLAIEKNLDIARLPPSEPALSKHILRAIWQINEWKQTIERALGALKLYERSELRAKRAMRMCPPSGQIFFNATPILSKKQFQICIQRPRKHKEKVFLATRTSVVTGRSVWG